MSITPALTCFGGNVKKKNSGLIMLAKGLTMSLPVPELSTLVRNNNALALFAAGCRKCQDTSHWKCFLGTTPFSKKSQPSPSYGNTNCNGFSGINNTASSDSYDCLNVLFTSQNYAFFYFFISRIGTHVAELDKVDSARFQTGSDFYQEVRSFCALTAVNN